MNGNALIGMYFQVFRYLHVGPERCSSALSFSAAQYRFFLSVGLLEVANCSYYLDTFLIVDAEDRIEHVIPVAHIRSKYIWVLLRYRGMVCTRVRGKSALGVSSGYLYEMGAARYAQRRMIARRLYRVLVS